MKLWRLENPDAKYNHHGGFVIAAPSAKAARKMAQEEAGGETTPAWTTHIRDPTILFWIDPKMSRCTLLSHESQIKKAGIVLVNYIGD